MFERCEQLTVDTRNMFQARKLSQENNKIHPLTNAMQ